MNREQRQKLLADDRARRRAARKERLQEPAPAPLWLEELVDRGIRDGVTLSVTRGGARHEVTAVHWRPGDSNRLAESVIRYADRPVLLDLDGHEYVVMPRDQYAGELPEA
jgi:hypothetical protein